MKHRLPWIVGMFVAWITVACKGQVMAGWAEWSELIRSPAPVLCEHQEPKGEEILSKAPGP